MPNFIDAQTLRPLALGAAVLSAGANSFPYDGYIAARELLGQRPPVRLLPAAEIADGAHIAAVAMVGAPLALHERLVDPQQFARAVTLLSSYLHTEFDAVMAYEIGASNALIPAMVAALTGLPLVDADTVGRSFPELQMSSFAMAGIDMTPMAVSDIRRNDVMVLSSASPRWLEHLVRQLTTACGSVSAVSSAYTGSTVKRFAIHGSYDRALRLGSALLEAKAAKRNPIEVLADAGGGVVLGAGTVVDVERHVTEGFVRGHASIQVGSGSAASLTVRFQNEFTTVETDDRRLATVPDLICMIDTVGGEPLGTEALRYGQRVAIMRFPALERHLTPEALAVLGPRALGYQFDYQSSAISPEEIRAARRPG